MTWQVIALRPLCRICVCVFVCDNNKSQPFFHVSFEWLRLIEADVFNVRKVFWLLRIFHFVLFISFSASWRSVVYNDTTTPFLFYYCFCVDWLVVIPKCSWVWVGAFELNFSCVKLLLSSSLLNQRKRLDSIPVHSSRPLVVIFYQSSTARLFRFRNYLFIGLCSVILWRVRSWIFLINFIWLFRGGRFDYAVVVVRKFGR